tara:strand:- start:8 stop:604 length:597 start_codon:yes stop_codon:yes gene_type:complete
MDDYTSFFLILICVTIFYLYLENKASEVTYVKKNNVEFLVRNVPDKEKAAELLSNIRDSLLKIVNHLDNEIKNKHNYDEKTVKAIKRLKKNYRPNNITESSPNNKYTSYSINKGDKIVFCLRSKTPPYKLVDLNTMMFVAIHELAHLMTKSIGHTPEFWDNMRFLLKVGIKLGVYKKHDYNNKPIEYCGTKITDSPLN